MSDCARRGLGLTIPPCRAANIFDLNEARGGEPRARKGPEMSRINDRPPSYLSCASLARELDVSESTVTEMVKRGVLPKPIKLSSGTVRWRWAAVEIALASLADGADGQASTDPFMVGVKNVTPASN